MEYECRGKKGAGGGRDREICEREAPKIDAFPMQNSRSTTLLVAGQHATGNPLLTSVSLSLSLPLSLSHARATVCRVLVHLSRPLVRLGFYYTAISGSVTYVLNRIESGIGAINTLLTLTTLIHNNGAAGIEFMVC